MSIAPKRSNLIVGQFCMLCVRLCECMSGIIWWLHFEIAISFVRKAYSFIWIIFVFQPDGSENL
jgi:hypothetical protein